MQNILLALQNTYSIKLIHTIANASNVCYGKEEKNYKFNYELAEFFLLCCACSQNEVSF
jgi:hypothetical protein